MAGEIQTENSTGKTLYFLVRTNAGAIWNGTTFEAYTPANWATYVNTLTEQGVTGYYVGNMPGAGAGAYTIDIRQQMTGSAATTDPGLGAGLIVWSGTAEITVGNAVVTSVTDKTGYALTTAEHTLVSGTDVPAALTAQGYTTTRAGYLDTLNGLVSNIWGAATRTLSAFGFTVTASSVTDKTGYALTTAEHTAISGTDVPAALTAQGYTTTRAGYLDTLNGLVAAIWAATTRTLSAFGFQVNTDVSTRVASYLDTTVSSRATPAQILATPANLLATNSAGKVAIDDTQLPAGTLTAGSIGELLVRAAAQRASFVITGNVATATLPGGHTITLTVDSATNPTTGTVAVT